MRSPQDTVAERRLRLTGHIVHVGCRMNGKRKRDGLQVTWSKT